MRRLITLQNAAALAIAGTGLGIFFGNTAIDAIDPHFYAPLPSAHYASLTPYRGAAISAPEPIQASAAETRVALGSGCVGCRTYPEEYHPDSALEEEAPEGYYAASLGAPNGYRPTVAEAAPEQDTVQRYASYAVTQDELREIAERGAVVTERLIQAQADAETLRQSEDEAAARGPEQLVY